MATLSSLTTLSSESATLTDDVVQTTAEGRFRVSRRQISSHDDRDLIAELLARSRGASQRFIKRFDPFFRNVILCSSHEARQFVDDLTQEVYICLWAHDFRVLRQWRGEHPLHAYLRTVIARLVWERLSRLQPSREILTVDPLAEAGERHEPLGMSATPERLVCTHELIGIVCNALESLNAQDRHILVLRYSHDLSYREIADFLGITTTNAGVRLARALGRLNQTIVSG